MKAVTRHWKGCLCSLVLLTRLWSGTAAAQAPAWDINTLHTLNQERARGLDGTFKAITYSVSPASAAVPVLMLGGGYLTGDSALFRKGLEVTATVAGQALISVILKEAIHRQRPFDAYPGLLDPRVAAPSYSMPSGHTGAAFALATSLTLAWPKWYVGVPAYTWAVAAGYSRLHLGVHYPTDVIAGAALGTACAVATHAINKRLRLGRVVPRLNLFRPRDALAR